MAKDTFDPALAAYIEVPPLSSTNAKAGHRDNWVATNRMLLDLGRFMERTGIEFEVTQVDTTVLRCECTDANAYTALRLAYGPFFIIWPRPTEQDEENQTNNYLRQYAKAAQVNSAKGKKSGLYPGSPSRTLWTTQTVTNVVQPSSTGATKAQIDALRQANQQALAPITDRDDYYRLTETDRKRREIEVVERLRQHAAEQKAAQSLIGKTDDSSMNQKYKDRLRKLRDTLKARSK